MTELALSTAISGRMEGVNSLYALISWRSRALNCQKELLNGLVHPILYKHFQQHKSQHWQGKTGDYDYPYGSIFNIEFSPSDSVALTACSHRAIVGYDPRITTSKPVHIVTSAHDDCTNCVTFLEEMVFCTCSDDKTIRVWDIRNLSTCMHILKGHTNWVKNIEYDPQSGNIFSIAFHDGIRVWNTGNFGGYVSEDPDNLVFKLFNPVRLRIAPDGSKMFVSLRKNKCCIIDRFDGSNLHTRQFIVQALLKDDKPLESLDFKNLKTNRPSLHIMSGLNGTTSYRAVMSAEFHPSSNIIALRHMDIKHKHFQQELTTLYNLKLSDEEYEPLCSIQKCSKYYLKYVDEDSPDDSLDFIKEFCFSTDGRVLASPYNESVRLLAVNDKCTPMEVYYDNRFCSSDKQDKCCDFEVLCTIVEGHCSSVLSCRFAHNDMLLGTGSLKGQIFFHKPQL